MTAPRHPNPVAAQPHWPPAPAPPGYPAGPAYGYPVDPRYGYPPAPQPPLSRAQRWDHGLSLTVWLIMLSLLPLFWYFSLFAIMATDVCAYQDCSDRLIGAAYLVGWAGAGLAALASLLGMQRAKKRRRPVWPWALAGVLAVAGCVWGFFVLLGAGVAGS